ncbi:MAG: alpha/beta hydrolase [Kineosporiaceae bacterium]
MDLLGIPFLLLSILLAIAAPVVALLLWSRVGGAPALQVAQRVGLLVLCQLTALLFASVALNDKFVFYESWSDLLGQDQQSAAVQADPSDGHSGGRNAAQPVGDADPQPLPGLQRIDGRQRVVREEVTGPRSGVHATITVVTPAGYADPRLAGRRYPVVVFLPGYPGTPSTWLHALNLQSVMDDEIRSHRIPPFIAVLPQINVAGTRDTECSDVVGGPRVGTWLGEDVPRIVASQTRALPPGRDWGITGYSTGGFCSVKLAFTNPETYGSAAVLAGYFSPEADTGAAGLFGGDTNRLHQNDPLWLVSHGRAPAARVLVVWSTQDPSTAEPTRAFLAAARPPLHVDELRLTQGGHNTAVWQSVLPQVLAWLGAGR